MSPDLDEFGEIARLFAPLTGGAREALGLLDDAALVAPPPGEELVVTTDTIVEGVHFLRSTPPAFVAQRLLRTNLSDLAAKAARPWGWFLNIAWPLAYDAAARAAFAAGLAEDQARYGLKLWGGDTVRTPGPLTASATLIGRAPQGAMVRRTGARAGDVLFVSGTIGDAGLGLAALEGGLGVLPLGVRTALIARHQSPEPRLPLRAALRAHAHAAADVSDGLLADAGRIARASEVAVEVALERTPLSPPARAWLEHQPDRPVALLRLATSGDDYEIVGSVAADAFEALAAAGRDAGVEVAAIGRVTLGRGVSATFAGEPVALGALGFTHG